MRQLGAINDPVYHAKPFNAVEQFFLRYIRDERDLPFVFLCIKTVVTVIPLAVALFLVDGIAWWVLAFLFLATEVYLMGPFILMLHNTSHNIFFKRQYTLGNRLIPWALCPFMGQSPDTYFSHHIGMHHAENNLELDKSSTMPYQRDSIVDFGKYFFRFLFVGIIDIVQYFKFKNKRSFFKKAIIGESVFLLVCLSLAWLDWKTTLLVFVLPLVIVRLVMMTGNWAQHAFVDRDAPDNNYLNSITCINNAYNKQCFNDGYHIGHHLKPHLHWTDMPGDFLKNTDKYATNRAFVFEGVDYNQIWAMLMFRRYDKLADHLVNVNGMYGSKEEAIALMQERTRKF